MVEKSKDIKILVNKEMDRIEREQTMDEYCKQYGKGNKDKDDVIWNKYRNMTLDKYLKLGEKDKQIIKTYMDERYCPVDYLDEYQGEVYVSNGIQWIDIISWGDGQIKEFIKVQKELIERCRKSPNCLNDYEIDHIIEKYK